VVSIGGKMNRNTLDELRNGKTTRPYKLKENVIGAPFCIGQTVKVVCGCDETFDSTFLNKIGEIAHFDYTSGCGQSFPHDPMIGVQFDKETIEAFWQEELKLARVSIGDL